MTCETKIRRNQTQQQRNEEVRKAIARFDVGLATGKIKATVGPQGAVALSGLSEAERDGVSDACAVRKILTKGSAQAKLALQKAELLSGRKISQSAMVSGVHSHDGGHSWHPGH